MYNILLVDDDKNMRMILRKVIEKKEGFKVIGEAGDCAKAIIEVKTKKPTIIFMDIELPDDNGVDCSKKILDLDPKAIIIFATAHEEYMSDAFEMYAFDYIMKPFSIERISETLDKIDAIDNKKVEYSLKGDLNKLQNKDRLSFKYKNEIIFIDINEIIFIEREDRRTVIYTIDNKYYTNDTLSIIEEKLDSKTFLRSHRSYIINIKKIRKIYQYGRWTYLIEFNKTDKDALITYKKLEELENSLN